MRLSGKQWQELHQSLMQAFPSYAALQRMVQFGLEENLEESAGAGELSQAVFELIQAKEAQGHIPRLVSAAIAAQPHHPSLQAFAKRYPELLEAAAPPLPLTQPISAPPNAPGASGSPPATAAHLPGSESPATSLPSTGPEGGTTPVVTQPRPHAHQPHIQEPRPTAQIGTTPLWVAIAGVVSLILTLLFFMGLVIAGVAGKEVPCNSRFLVTVVLGLGAAIGSGFLGGHAAAEGRLRLPRLIGNPISFGVGGGIAVLVIVTTLGHQLYGCPPARTAPQAPSVAVQVYEPADRVQSARSEKREHGFLIKGASAGLLSRPGLGVFAVVRTVGAPWSIQRPISHVDPSTGEWQAIVWPRSLRPAGSEACGRVIGS